MNPEPRVYTPEACIRNFASVLQYARIYTVKHHLSRAKIKGLHEYLMEYFKANADDFVFGVIMEELVSGKEVLIESSKLLKAFIALLRQRRIEKVTIGRQASLEELTLFIELLGDTTAYPVEQPIGEILLARNITGIKTGILSIEEMNAPQTLRKSDSPGTSYLRQYYASLIPAVTELIRKVYDRSADDKDAAMFIGLVDELTAHMDDDPEGLFGILEYLKMRNEYEYVHSAHVAILTMLQARSLNLDKKLVSQIAMAGFLHDVGKLSIPLEILNKPGLLSEEETQRMRQHPACGAQILIQYVPVFGELPVIVSFQHHRTYSGSGYPEPLTYTKELNLASRMATIADIYDALRSNRSYRPGIPPEKVYTLMRAERGTRFDPFLLDNFFGIMGIWPPGTIVELTNNLIGVVQSENTLLLDKPVVEVFFDTVSGEPITPCQINLEKEAAIRIHQSLGTEKLAEKHITVPEQYRV